MNRLETEYFLEKEERRWAAALLDLNLVMKMIAPEEKHYWIEKTIDRVSQDIGEIINAGYIEVADAFASGDEKNFQIEDLIDDLVDVDSQLDDTIVYEDELGLEDELNPELFDSICEEVERRNP